MHRWQLRLLLTISPPWISRSLTNQRGLGDRPISNMGVSTTTMARQRASRCRVSPQHRLRARPQNGDLDHRVSGTAPHVDVGGPQARGRRHPANGGIATTHLPSSNDASLQSTTANLAVPPSTGAEQPSSGNEHRSSGTGATRLTQGGGPRPDPHHRLVTKPSSPPSPSMRRSAQRGSPSASTQPSQARRPPPHSPPPGGVRRSPCGACSSWTSGSMPRGCPHRREPRTHTGRSFRRSMSEVATRPPRRRHAPRPDGPAVQRERRSGARSHPSLR